MRPSFLASALAAAIALPAPGGAQTPAEQKSLEEEIARELGETAAPPPSDAGQRPLPEQAAPERPRTGGSPYARLLSLPDISAIGRAAVAWNEHDVAALSPRSGPSSPESEPRAVFEELELGLQSVVDPYLRADAFIAFGGEGAEVEEAFVTTLRLPAALQVRAGTFFSPFGRITQQHPHVWELVDAPLGIGRLLAEETIRGPGVEVGWLAPLPWFAELRLAGQSFAPGEEDPEALTGVARLLQYVSLGDALTAGLGLSAAVRDEGRSAFRDLAGVDVHVRFRRPESRSYLSAQAEVWGRRFRGVEDGPRGFDTGGYGQLFWKAGPHLGLGLRQEWAPAAGEGGEGREHRTSLLGGWFPSEFQRVRLQLSHDRLPGGRGGLEALLQLEFGIGAHGAHPF
jgi:hypothetical protein